MDHYEEFGLPRTATPDQIRQTHKSLVRLLHPDQFQDPDLKRLAEGQMKRINEIFAALSEPVRGSPPGEARAILPLVARYRAHAGWCAAGVVALAWAWTAMLKPPAPELRPTAGLPPRPTYAMQAPLPHSSPRPAPRARRSPLREPPAVTAEIPELPRQPTTEPPPPPASPTVASTVLPVDSEQSPRKPKGLAGHWLYVRPPVAPPSRELYPPEYIEAAIIEERGMLRGRYRARYKVTDRAISPEVDFQFEGAVSGDVVLLPWTGGGGARGEVQLRQISPDSLEVKWLATDLGRIPGLASGTAVLVRRQEP